MQAMLPSTMAKSEPVGHRHFQSENETEETKPDLNETGSDIFNMINNANESPMQPI